jgi:ATP-binding cassette, subfamily F, member 3
LLLDEPTNHLDLDMREAIVMALQGFEGAIVVVSHDRHLLASTTDEFYLVAHSKVAPFPGDLADYYQWLQNDAKAQQPIAEPVSNGAAQRKDQKRLEADLRNLTRVLKQTIEKLEKQQHQLESKLATLEEKLADSGLYEQSRKAEMTKVLAEQTKFKAELTAIEEQWFEAQEQLEQQTAEFWQSNAG